MEEKGELDHYIGVATTETSPHFSQLDVPACTWAVFEAVGPFPKHCRKHGPAFMRSGSHHLAMNRLQVQKSCAIQARIFPHQSLQVKSGYRFRKEASCIMREALLYFRSIG